MKATDFVGIRTWVVTILMVATKPRYEPVLPGKPETIASPTMFHFAAPEASFEIIGETKPAQTPAPKPDWNWQSFVVLFWATGVFLLLLRLLFVFFRLSHWRPRTDSIVSIAGALARPVSTRPV